VNYQEPDALASRKGSRTMTLWFPHFGYNQILVRDGKGRKDRVTMLPEKLKEPMQRHLARVKLLH
jgi:hypothetical protein